jgi:hypothetical protein
MELTRLLGSPGTPVVCSELSSLNFADHLICRGDGQAPNGRMIRWKTPLKSEYRFSVSCVGTTAGPSQSVTIFDEIANHV